MTGSLACGCRGELGRPDPEIRGSGIKVEHQGLSRGTNLHWAQVAGIVLLVLSLAVRVISLESGFLIRMSVGGMLVNYEDKSGGGFIHFTLSAISRFLHHLLSLVLEGAWHSWLHAMLAIALHHEDIGAWAAGLVVGVTKNLDLGEVVGHVCGRCGGCGGGLSGFWYCG